MGMVVNRLLGPLAGGETGAMLIEAADGERRVLKWELDPSNQAARTEALVLADRLRTEAGWPIPRQTAVQEDSWLFVTQQFMDGEPIDRLSHGKWRRVWSEVDDDVVGGSRAADEGGASRRRVEWVGFVGDVAAGEL